MAVAEAEDAAVLEEAADDALYADALRQAGDARAEAADAADDEVDLDSGGRGLIELVDDGGIDEGVELQPDRRRPARPGVGDLALDQLDDAPEEGQRRQRQLGEGVGL